MRHISRVLCVLGVLTLSCTAAQAQLFRAYLASYGADTNPCTVAAPCRLLPTALAAVADGGEIWMLDSANFNTGTVSVMKNVAIRAIPGQVGSIVPVGNAPAMAVTGAFTVTLRNISMVTNAVNPGTYGVEASGGALLTVEDSVFHGKHPTNDSAGIWAKDANTRVAVHRSQFRNCENGVLVQDGAMAEISDSQFVNCYGTGVYVLNFSSNTTAYANVVRSSFAGNYAGVLASGFAGGAKVGVLDSNFVGNHIAVLSDSSSPGAAVVSVGANLVTGNEYGFFQVSDAVLESIGNNVVRGNATANVVGTVTVIPGT